MKRVFITGGTGFFGKSMLDYRLRHPDWTWACAEWQILSRNADSFRMRYPELALQPGVSFVDGDVSDFAYPADGADVILHMASPLQGTLGDDDMKHQVLAATRRIAGFAAETGARLLFTSSGAVYGKNDGPVVEDDVCVPKSGYGQAKLESEKFFCAHGVDVRIARCFAFVGRYLPRSGGFAIGNFIRDCLDGNEIVISGDGTPLRSYLYADDLVEWLFAILERGVCGRPYNVGSDLNVSIRDLASRVRESLQAETEIRVLIQPSGNPPSVYVPNVNRIKKELGMDVRVGLEEAIVRSAK